MRIIKSIVFAAIVLITAQQIIAQDADSNAIEKISPRLGLSVLKNSDQSRTLTGTLEFRNKETKEIMPIENAELIFSTGTNQPVTLGKVKTSAKGTAKFTIPADFKFTRNPEGFIHFSVDFAGDEKFESNMAEMELVDIQLKMTLETIDSIKMIKVSASKINAKEESEPLNEETVTLAVARMFSHLKIGEITLTEGEGEFEFSTAIPGDSLGNITVIAKFDDHEMYGSVQKSETISWGVKTSHHTVYHPRSLWTSVAPVWMIVTLSVMLLGVWGHYVYTVVELIRLKRLKDKPEN